jgi:hypothetical protein
MLKNKLFATAVAAGIMAPMSAQAVYVSLDGSGQALLYPYYNVNDGNVTFVSVTNTTAVPKALKVRFREGTSSHAVFNFSLYLSPHDVWVAALYRSGDNVMLSVPSDTSCTVPVAATLANTPFNSTRIDAAYTGDIPNRLSEGHLEIIEMAELRYTLNASDIADAITHDQTTNPVAPVDCSVPATFNSAQQWAILDAGDVTANGVVQDFTAPGGGLIGNAAVFNPNSGIYFPYNATALRQYSENPIWWPQNSQEFQLITDVAGGGVAAITGGNDSNGNAHTNYFSADDDSPLVNGNALNFDLPDLSTPSVGEVATGDAIASQFTTDDGSNTPALMGDLTIKTGTFNGAVSMEDNKRDAVSASLMGNAIIGEYITSGTYATDWVVTFPTRYLHVNTDTKTNAISAPSTERKVVAYTR